MEKNALTFTYTNVCPFARAVTNMFILRLVLGFFFVNYDAFPMRRYIILINSLASHVLHNNRFTSNILFVCY